MPVYAPDYCESIVVLSEPTPSTARATSEVGLSSNSIDAPDDNLLVPRDDFSILPEVQPDSDQPKLNDPIVVADLPIVVHQQPYGNGVNFLQPLKFADYPWSPGTSGVMRRGLQKNWSGSVLFEYGSSFDGLDRQGVGFLVEHSSRIGIDFKWDSYVEDLGNGWTDELHLTEINVLCRVAQSENYLIRAGMGVNVLGDAFGTDAGFNVTTKADFFPVKPIVISGEVDVGTIGDAEMFHVSGKIGCMWDRFELFGGYDYRTIGGVPLKGPMLGVQVWF